MVGRIELGFDGNAPIPAGLRLRGPSLLTVADVAEQRADDQETPKEERERPAR
jgi:hypothetical protein